MNEELVLDLLALKHKKGFAFFPKFRPMTSFDATLNEIDALAIGLWEQNKGIFAYEIKTSLQDFRTDVDKFQYKHRFALELSTEFYYVCPWGLIPKNEIPEVAGLMYINSGNRFNKIKRAVIREYKPVEFHLLQGFALRCGAKINPGGTPVRYLGKDITAEDIDKLVKAKIDTTLNWKIENKAKELIKESTKTHEEMADYWYKLLRVGIISSWRKDLSVEFNELASLVKIGRNVNDIKQKLRLLNDSINKLLKHEIYFPDVTPL